jgi:ATP-binding cassette subfamily C protein LapB
MIAVVGVGVLLQYLVGEEIGKAQTESSLRHAMLVEAVGAIETIKTMRAEGQFLRRWDRLIRVASATQERIKSISSMGVNVTLFFQQLVTIGIIVAGAYRFADREITTGAIIAAVMLSSRAVAPLTQIALMLTRLRYAISAMKTLNGIMNLQDERVATESFVNRAVEHGKLEFRNVAFQYPLNTRLVLDGINLTISPGEKVGIIGKVGSGKTTFGRLVAGFYAPAKGEILVDGVDLRQYHPHEIRKAVGLVMQDTDLFIGSIKANLLLANPSASDADLIKACKLAGVDDFVSLHPLGYDLPVGERGRNLSTGQKQAVALARVLLMNPMILFLDEPSSAMDLATEQSFLMRLKQMMRPDQTLLITTHRHSMLELVDRIIILDNGRVVADGSKANVLNALKRPAAV